MANLYKITGQIFMVDTLDTLVMADDEHDARARVLKRLEGAIYNLSEVKIETVTLSHKGEAEPMTASGAYLVELGRHFYGPFISDYAAFIWAQANCGGKAYSVKRLINPAAKEG